MGAYKNMREYKNIRVSDNVLQELKAMQKDGDSVQGVLIVLCNTWSDMVEDSLGRDNFSKLEFIRLRVAQSHDIIVFEVERDERGLDRSRNAKRFEYISGNLKNTIRLPIGCVSTLDTLKVHPDETYNTTVFKLICINKAIAIWDKEFS